MNVYWASSLECCSCLQYNSIIYQTFLLNFINLCPIVRGLYSKNQGGPVIMPHRVLIINRKSYTGFRLISTSMTLDDLERRYFAFFADFGFFAGQIGYSGWRQAYNVLKYCLPVPVFHFGPQLSHPAARSLCDSWATCLYFVLRFSCIFLQFCVGFIFMSFQSICKAAILSINYSTDNYSSSWPAYLYTELVVRRMW